MRFGDSCDFILQCICCMSYQYSAPGYKASCGWLSISFWNQVSVCVNLSLETLVPCYLDGENSNFKHVECFFQNIHMDIHWRSSIFIEMFWMKCQQGYGQVKLKLNTPYASSLSFCLVLVITDEIGRVCPYQPYTRVLLHLWHINTPMLGRHCTTHLW